MFKKSFNGRSSYSKICRSIQSFRQSFCLRHLIIDIVFFTCFNKLKQNLQRSVKLKGLEIFEYSHHFHWNFSSQFLFPIFGNFQFPIFQFYNCSYVLSWWVPRWCRWGSIFKFSNFANISHKLNCFSTVIISKYMGYVSEKQYYG